jgi:hypothetical protein
VSGGSRSPIHTTKVPAPPKKPAPKAKPKA